MLVGAHVSAAGGHYRAFENARAIGASCIQIFGASPRSWAAPLPGRESVEKFNEERKKHPEIKAIFLHAAYLPNLASGNIEAWQKSVVNLSRHLAIAELFGADGLVFHIGSAIGISREEGIANVARGIGKILENVPGRTKILLENASGGGNKLGGGFSEIGKIVKSAGSARVGVCLDTAHACGAGIVDSFTQKNIAKMFDEFDAEIGLERLAVLHANDSKASFGSGIDRHENIGKGAIGLEGFEALAKEKRINKLPWILEVPGFDGSGPDKKNVDTLKACF